MEILTNITLGLNLVLSVIITLIYGVGFFRINHAQVDGNLKLTKISLLFLFIAIAIKAILQVVVYSVVLYDTGHTQEALYLENFKNLFINIAFLVNAILLALIVEGKGKIARRKKK